jgi:hypothetical protein
MLKGAAHDISQARRVASGEHNPRGILSEQMEQGIVGRRNRSPKAGLPWARGFLADEELGLDE